MSEKRPGIETVVGYLMGQRSPIVIDLGAHTGKTTKIWLDAGAKLVVAVEPLPRSVCRLEERFKGDERVVVSACVVAADKGYSQLYIPDKYKGKDRSQGCTIFREPLKEKKRSGKITGYGKVPVMSYRLTDLLNALKKRTRRPVDLLKVNIEGAEYDVLDGVPEEIRAIFVSWHSHAPFDTKQYRRKYEELCRQFKSDGFKRITKESRGDHLWEFWKK